MNSVKSVSDHFVSLCDNVRKDVLPFRDLHLNRNKNKIILEATLTFIKNSERFYESPRIPF